MKQFNVVLRKVAIETNIVVKSIPSRLYYAIKNKFVMVQHSVWTVVKKIIAPTKAIQILESSSLTMSRTISERSSNQIVLDSDSRAVANKNTIASLNIIEIRSNVASYNFTRYRRLGDMDSNGTTPFDLASFDDISLEDLDYITI